MFKEKNDNIKSLLTFIEDRDIERQIVESFVMYLFYIYIYIYIFVPVGHFAVLHKLAHNCTLTIL